MRPGWKKTVSFHFCDDWEEASLMFLGDNKENNVLKRLVLLTTC